MTAESENHIRSFLGDLTVVQLTPEICKSTIEVRRQHRLKLPDAIIAGTAKTLDAELITNDENLLKLTELTSTPATLRT